ncbi:SUKH-3 domain-containing protein [Variovorax sp. RB3P1]|jgi:hypothetical protein|uniref:SUKH-3 domain-containing protein n=1 Tax=Variovorax sp. RB3P1 TaxID=3443732 RepID=UPI003F45D0D8
MIYQLNPKLTSALGRFGWNSARKIETNQFASDWKKDGYKIFREALDFAGSFGGIKLVHPAYSGELSDESHFDPSAATRRLDRAWVVEDYERLAGEVLIPIGQGYSGHLTFLIGDCGGFFGGYDDYFCRMGKTVEEALDKIMFGGKFQKLSE